MKITGSLAKAREYAFLLLKFRPRSEKEIRERLERKGFSTSAVRETITFLKEKKFIDDRIFAQAWIDYRIVKPLGLRRLKKELQAKGIDREIIEDCIEDVKKDYPEEEIVEEIARKHLAKLKYLDKQKARRRTCDFLLRRGFSPYIVIEIMKRLNSCVF